LKVGMFRPVTLWPFPEKELQDATKNAKKVLTVEMSMGQMIEDVKLAINCSKPVEFYGRTGGIIPAPADILNKIKEMGGNK
ncbi:MAG: 3-methyl-2-oxobutanoate dehydrogenase subunit beta, partial [Ruminiclostridium sp.]|nr:3-methyl-2-oxobutanoate dehydrogenase subunit beta [Ruminiclostridium sp.]